MLSTDDGIEREEARSGEPSDGDQPDRKSLGALSGRALWHQGRPQQLMQPFRLLSDYTGPLNSPPALALGW